MRLYICNARRVCWICAVSSSGSLAILLCRKTSTHARCGVARLAGRPVIVFSGRLAVRDADLGASDGGRNGHCCIGASTRGLMLRVGCKDGVVPYGHCTHLLRKVVNSILQCLERFSKLFHRLEHRPPAMLRHSDIAVLIIFQRVPSRQGYIFSHQRIFVHCLTVCSGRNARCLSLILPFSVLGARIGCCVSRIFVCRDMGGVLALLGCRLRAFYRKAASCSLGLYTCGAILRCPCS